ncbi:TDT family transporter [Streptomyces sp. CBMA152]|uniref:TDT family transporter n=1 Tax=Streptomyces sp. CBMA152 TaxID=1896312 RepID=UPI001660EB85|nr:TDT family transporter [Streptomyces sp. CBMA152]MBD0740801.1 C4-dicarboxylate ABC transporter [Streptomyces sp. CBMA152]
MVTLIHSRTQAPATPLSALRHLGPNWYAAVMGTAIIANAGAGLPFHIPGLTVIWALSLTMLVVLVTARAVHWTHHRDQARAHLLDPGVAPFYGCMSMAFLAVGIGTLTVGKNVIGEGAAVTLAWILYGIGTLTGLAVAVGIPYLMVVRHKVASGTASPVWLLPVVAPMVSATLGALLVPHLPVGQPREAMLLASYAMFGMSLLATMVMLPLVFSRLVHEGPLPLALTPALFLVLGPLGQSTTAVNKLADVATGAIDAPYANGLSVFAVVYGVPVIGFALMWLALATAMVVRAARAGMPFAMTWWAFTFPVGTCVTGAEGLAHHTGLAAFDWLSVGLYALLATAWLVAGFHTVRGLVSGRLLAAPR